MPKLRVLDELSAANAYQRGRMARQAGAVPSLNEFATGSPEHDEWRKGWQSRDAEITTEELKRQRAMRAAPCRYQAGLECSCGGRGLCLDVA